MEIKCKDHNVDFIDHKNINLRHHVNQDCLHPNRKAQSENYISNSQHSNEIGKGVKSSKDHDGLSLLRKQRLQYLKNVIFGHVKINSLQNKLF